ncbi:MAG: large subunit ribosomal protein [Patescibacteria group bacterium]|nr:large subunit ribosomal protein [Patescibacteria group bacterium]
MKVILLKDVIKVGNKDSVLDFADGYAQNVLIAKGLAIKATPHELLKLEDKKRKLQNIKDEENKIFNELILQLNKKVFDLHAKSNEKGHLFSAVKKIEIAKMIIENIGINIQEENIIFPQPIKELGLHSVVVKKGDREGEFKINVI